MFWSFFSAFFCIHPPFFLQTHYCSNKLFNSFKNKNQILSTMFTSFFLCFVCIYLQKQILGLIHTRNFGTQYCDKKIILSHMFQWTTKLWKTYFELFCLFIYLDLFFCEELTLAFRYPWLKNIFLSRYCASKCLVWIRP